jgi:hypothetical protein
MINELYSLAKTLDGEGISSNEWYRKYKELPKVTAKSPCIRIWLADDGAVCDLENITAEQATVLRKYGNNQNSFPAFNISSLYRLTDAKSIAEIEKLEKGQSKPDTEKIRSWCSENNWIKGVPGQIQRSLNDCPTRLLEKIGLQPQVEDNITTKLANLCNKLCTEVDGGFRASLESCIFEKLHKGEDIALALMLLFHKGSATKEHRSDTGSKLSVIMDVQNWRTYGYPVASEHTTLQLNALLLASENKVETQGNSSLADAFGSPFVNPNEPMPSVRLSGFEVTLRSMFKGQPCQRRYKRIADGSYPIATKNRSSIKKALEWVAAPSRRQITWEKVDKNEIAFIYPSKFPGVPPKFASIFGKGPNEGAKRAAARFESAAKEFTRAFRGLPPNQKPDMMQIFTIRKMDDARSKVIFTHNSTPEQLIQATNDWSLGCRNLPGFEIGELITPFPLDVADIVNGVWKQNGERADGKASVKRMKYYQGMELLLGIMPQSTVYNFMRITIENSSGLINHLGNWLHSGGKCERNADFRHLAAQKKSAAQIFSVLGLLLYKCEKGKENYMEELAYLLGQLLHVSDELHTMYCKVKRDGDIPPQLAGAALFVTAGEMPYQALAQLSVRITPYYTWAKQYRYMDITEKGKESWRVKWILGLFEQLSNKVYPTMKKAVRFSDYEKAQLFIGYMASLTKRDTSNESGNIDKNEIAGGIDNE